MASYSEPARDTHLEFANEAPQRGGGLGVDLLTSLESHVNSSTVGPLEISPAD